MSDAEYHKLCSQCWDALGVTEYTGKHIVEHITDMKAELTRLRGENKDFSDLLWSVVHSDMAMREEDEGNKSQLLSSIREVLAKHNKGSE